MYKKEVDDNLILSDNLTYVSDELIHRKDTEIKVLRLFNEKVHNMKVFEMQLPCTYQLP